MVLRKDQAAVGRMDQIDVLALQSTPPPARGVTTWLVEALRAAVADGRFAGRVAAARHPGARRRPRYLARRRRRGLSAADRRGDAHRAYGCRHCRHRDGAAPRQAGDRRATSGLRLPLAPSAGIDLDLSPGVPDLSAFPRAAWLRAERIVLGRGDQRRPRVRGSARQPPAARELAGWLSRTRGVQAAADDLIVVNGVAQALALLSQTLRARGITEVGMEDPGSRGTRDELEHWGLRAVPVPVDDQGVRVHALVAASLRPCCSTPAHQFPTGVVLSPHRRRALLDWPGLIIEDDYDAEHRYDRAPVAALRASAPERVAYAGSVSKSLAPAMRLGWLIAPRHLHADLVTAKHASDLGNPALPQLILARLLATGAYESHVRTVRRRQRQRRDALLAGLRAHLPSAQVQGVAAGLHLLITLPGAGDDLELARRLEEVGVRVHPLSWHRRLPGPPGLVLGYAALPPDRLHEAARRIGAQLDRAPARLDRGQARLDRGQARLDRGQAGLGRVSRAGRCSRRSSADRATATRPPGAPPAAARRPRRTPCPRPAGWSGCRRSGRRRAPRRCGRPARRGRRG